MRRCSLEAIFASAFSPFFINIGLPSETREVHIGSISSDSPKPCPGSVYGFCQCRYSCLPILVLIRQRALSIDLVWVPSSSAISLYDNPLMYSWKTLYSKSLRDFFYVALRMLQPFPVDNQCLRVIHPVVGEDFHQGSVSLGIIDGFM